MSRFCLLKTEWDLFSLCVELDLPNLPDLSTNAVQPGPVDLSVDSYPVPKHKSVILILLMV